MKSSNMLQETLADGAAGAVAVDVAVAIRLFDGETVSAAQGARMAHVSLVEFMRLCSEQGVPVVRYPPSELDMEVANVRRAAGC